MTVENSGNKENQQGGENGKKEKIYTITTKDEKGRKQEVVIQREGEEKRGGSVLDVYPTPKKKRT